MANNYEEGLKGSADQAIASQKQIGKYFTAYGSSGLKDASKHQLIYATKVMHSIAKCELKHPKIYCGIIVEIFGDLLKPEAGAKYWDSYVDSLRYFHYNLAAKKEYEMASLLYNHVLLYNNKLENESVCFKLVNIYSYHLFLQNSLLTSDRETALREAHNVLDNLIYLFQEMLQKNKQLNFQYKDILKKSFQCLFPRTGQSKISHFFNTLRDDKVSTMLESIFKLCSQQRMPLPPREEAQQYGLCIMETLYTLLQFDINNKFRLQLSVQLLNHCRVDNQIVSYKPMAELCTLLYEYLKLICLQSNVADFPKHFIKRCERFTELFDQHSKILIAQPWFRDFLVLLNYLHSQLENTTIFASFWEQMSTPLCFKSLLSVIMETMKLAPCITADTTLNWITCCSSFRKHVILSFAQIALSTFVLYCQKIPPEQENTYGETVRDTYYEGVHKILILIINHAFKVIEKMDCIVSTSQDMNHLITRFKQAAISAKTKKQAGTCISLCELFLKLRLKLSEHEWPLMLRRVYRVVEQSRTNNFQLKRDLQMCYITSLLQLSSEVDFTQIRAQITMYYSQNPVDDQENASPELIHDKCLLHMYQHSTNVLKPQLNAARKKLLHWLEMQHIVKYYKSNVKLMQSLMQCSQTQYDFVMMARLEKVQPSHVLAKLVTIQKSLKSKAEESAGLSRLEQLTYGHTCLAILQDQKNVLVQKASKFESKDFGEGQLGNLLTRSEMETMAIRKELCYVKLAYVAFKAFEKFYQKFDDEQISSDDALIDWEAIIDDLVALAQFLQLGGYIEYCSHAWVLLYKISLLVQDNLSAFRALAFICEYSEFFGKNTDSPLELDSEIQLQLPSLTEALGVLPSLSTRKQTYVLLVTIQIAYYYIRCSKYTFAQMLLQFVEQKHHELPERQGRYDVVMCTLDIVRYRVLWKHFEGGSGKSKARKIRSAGEYALLNQNLMHEIELTLDRFRNFVYLSSSDSLMYIVLICNFLQDIAECSANRLYDNFMTNVFTAVCKCALSHGLALRMVQIMSSWMWINLQMEFVDEAHTKLKIMEYIMGVATLKELSDNKVAAATTVIKSNTLVPSPSIDILSLGHNTGIEAMRRLAQVQLSPIKTGKLQLRTLARKHDLKSYLSYKIETTSMPSSELFEWIYFIIACFNARLNFLIEDFDQLEAFYEQGSEWLNKRQNDFHKRYFKNFQLVAMQHYANFLRASREKEKAKQCLTYALELCECMKLDIDVVYRVNFKLQLLSTCAAPKNNKYNKTLTYNVSPEENKEKHDEAKQTIKDQILQQAMSSSRKPPVTGVTTSSNSATTSALRNKDKQNRGDSSSPETKSKTKPKLKFNICSDSMDTFDLNANIDLVECKTTAKLEVKSTTPTNDIGKPVPRSSRKDKKSTKTPSKTKANDSHSIVTIDLLDSPQQSTSATPGTSSSSSFMACLEIKENQPENEIVKQLENLKSAETKKKSPNVSRLRKPAQVRKPISPPPVIFIGDSPGAMLSKANKQHSGMRRQRKIIVENNETQESNHPTSSAAIASSSVSTRRRQNLI